MAKQEVLKLINILLDEVPGVWQLKSKKNTIAIEMN